MQSQFAQVEPTTEIRDVADPAQLIRVVICGEVSAGKSTVLNAMLREVRLPDNLGNSSRSVLHISHAANRMLEITHANGRTDTYDEIVIPRDLPESCRVDIHLDQPQLQGFELIEIPMTTAEDLTERHIELVRSAHVIIWVTIASQAWRLTEKTIVEKLGDARPAHGILAVSRADKLRSKADREKLRDRIVRETSPFFESCVFVHGSRKTIGKATTSDEIWADTGGAEIIDLLETLGQKALAEMPTPEVAVAPPIEPEATVVESDEDEAKPGVVDFASYVSARDGVAEEGDLIPAEAASGESESGDLEAELRALTDGMAPSIHFGILPQDDPEACIVLNGDNDNCRTVASACQNAFRAMGAAYSDDPVNSCVLTLGANRLMMQDVSGVGMVFMVSEKNAISFGMAHRTMAKVCDTCAAHI